MCVSVLPWVIRNRRVEGVDDMSKPCTFIPPFSRIIKVSSKWSANLDEKWSDVVSQMVFQSDEL